MALIEIDDLTKEFADVRALDDLSFTVEEGEIFGFLGPNGAGKSTTINILLGFTRATSGSASVFGLDVEERSKAIRQRTGALLEGYGVYERITAREHVERAIQTKGADDDPLTILERVGIADSADRKAGGFSKGMRQRLAIGMALVGDPDLLVLDEPSTGLDPNGTRQLRQIIREESRRGATVFFSSHLIDQVEAVCDRVGIVKEGHLVRAGNVSDLRAELDAATVTVSVGEAPESLLEELRAVAGVEEVTATDRQITVSARDGQSKLTALNRINEAGVGFADFTSEEPSLEEVFSRATLGTDGRDERERGEVAERGEAAPSGEGQA
ncbi:MAG: ATP-binding cassette domain-containing protein [Haloarculaceae archaeon]